MSYTREYVKFLVGQVLREQAVDAVKSRDPKEPMRREKLAMEERLTKFVMRRFRRQLGNLRSRLEGYLPERKVVTTPPPPVDDLFDDEEEMEELVRILLKGAMSGIDLFGQAITFDVDWTLTNQRAAKWAREYAYDLVRGIDETSRKIIRDAVAGFVETPGMTIGDVMEQIQLTGFGERRSQMIATTETTRTYAQGQKLAGEQLKQDFPDVRIVKTWFTNNDDLVCDICGPNHSEEVELDEEFPSGDAEPPAHVNCRCWIGTSTRING